MFDLKIGDWSIQRVEARSDEENACVVSFRVSNVIGIAYFLMDIKDIFKEFGDMKNFNAGNLILLLGKIASNIYQALKNAKKRMS